jgi:hypothetical protein
MTRKFAVVTTFHDKGLKTYAQRMIDTFCQNWPEGVTLYVYPEDCNPRVPDHSRLELRDLHTSIPELVRFKEKWRNVPKAIGEEPMPPLIRNAKKQKGLGFKWDAVRLSHKVYAICHAAKNTDADVLIWMDADTVCHSPITNETLEKFVPADVDLCFLGRKPKYTECGLYAMNLRSPATKSFLEKFQWMYDYAELGIFTLEEWHDSFVFDVVRKNVSLKELDWSRHLVSGEGHPLINSEWGAYLDHLKGIRKEAGRSFKQDLFKTRLETYWK